MSTTLTIHITKEVLYASRTCQQGLKAVEDKIGQNCAIGMAIHHIFPNSWTFAMSIYVNDYPIVFNRHGDISSDWYFSCELIDLPREASMFITKFDQSTPDERIAMQPFSFDIEVPDEVINQINIDEVLKLANTVTRKELV